MACSVDPFALLLESARRSRDKGMVRRRDKDGHWN